MKQFALFARCVRSLIVPVALLLGSAAPAAAQVVFDAASNAGAATVSNATPTFPVSWNHTVGLSKKPYLVVEVALKLNGGGATVSGVAYGTEAGGPASGGPAANTTMVFLGAATNGTNDRAELWGIAGPAPGTHQITVTVANGGGQNLVVVAGAKSFFNVFQTAANGAAVGGTGNTITPSVTLAANSPLDYVVDAVAYNANQALAAGASQTSAFNLTNAAPAFSGGGSIKTGFANTTMSWTAGVAAQWAAVAVNLQSANPQISFDAASTSPALQSAANPITVTWNHTTTNAANRYLVVGVAIHLAGGTVGTNVTVNAPTYGAQTMTFIARQTRTTNVDVELWGLVAPASGTNTISFTVANTGARALSVVAGAQSFSNVDQNTPLGTPIGNNNNNAAPTVTVANSAYDYVVDVIGFNTNQALTPGANQDARWATVTGGTAFSGAGSGARGYTNVTMSWTPAAGSTNWAIEAVPLRQVTVGLKKTASADVIKLGGTVTYTITATNYTNATVNNVTITDAIPVGASFVSQTGCGGVGPVTCNIGSLTAGTSSAPITVTVVPNGAGSISNVATVSYNGAATFNSSETVSTLAEQKICATPGKDGLGNTLAGIVNDYWPGTATVAAGVTSIAVGARDGNGALKTLTAGDLIIIMQMQDAAFDTTNDETYGEGTGSTRATGTGSGAATTLNNAGRWEYAVVASTVPAGGIAAAGGTININGGGLGGGTLYGYTTQTFAATTTQGQRTYQVIRVPQYTTATLGSTLTAVGWAGTTGGILAVDVSGTLTLGSATVSVDGLGFRGGAGVRLKGDTAANGLVSTDFRTLAPDSATAPTIHMENGSKGEGIAGTPRYVYHNGATIGAPGTNSALDTGVEGYVNGSYGRGGPGNGGGGSTDGDPAGANPNGNDMNSGGGGGGNGGNGGSGGNGWSCNCPGGGQGGGSISPSLTRITMGGGGGAGTSNNGSATDALGNVLADDGGPNAANANGYYSSGADGGGIIIMRALQATGTATLTANGLNGPNTGRDGPGGGGAGGSVLLTTQAGNLSGVTIQAKGGNGGSAWIMQAPAGSPGERHGPGGGGGGGYILLSSAAASTNVSGGANGVTTNVLDPYGAQPGTVGIVQLITGNNVLPGGDGASCAVADLAVTDSSPSAPVDWNSNVTFTQTVVNNGTTAADSVVYRQAIPASSTFVSMSPPPPGWTCITPAVGGTGDVTCTKPTLLPSDGVQNFTLTVKDIAGTPAGFLITDTNTVSSLTPDSNPANNTASASTPDVPISDSDMAVTLTNNANTATTAGSNVTFTSVATNIGAAAATAATWSMVIPPNMSFQSVGVPAGWTCITPAANATSGTISCTANSTIASNAASTFQPVFKVVAGTPAGTSITGTANTGASNDPNLTNNTATSTFTVNGAAGYDMVATLNAVATASTTDIGTLATNSGFPTVTGTGTSFTKQLKSGDVINIPGQGYFVVASVTDDTHLVLKTNATATASGLAYTEVNSADLSPEVVSPAGTLTFTSVVTNNGQFSAPAAGAGVQWVMAVPANTTFQSIGTVPPGWVCVTPAVGGTGTITCTLQTAGVNQPFPTTLTSAFSPVFNVNAGTASGTTITGTATVNINGVTTADNVPSNNTDNATAFVTTASNADVAIVKSVSPNPIGSGQITNYTLAVTNNGPSIATNVTVSDVLPGTLTFVSSSISSNIGACAGTTTVTCTINTLPVNNTATISLILQATTTGTIPNTASITGATQTDPVASNNSSTANLTVLNVTLVKLRTFTATQSGQNVQVAWATSFESDNLGFNVYRDVNGQRVKVNKSLIAGTGLISKKKDLVSDHIYRLNDALDSASTFPQYWLEDVDIKGIHTLHGPVTPVSGAVDRPVNAVPLPGLGSEGSIIDSPDGNGIVRPADTSVPTAKQLKQQGDLAGATALKIYVTKEGWYHLTRAQMTTAGFDPGSDGRTISLYNLGVEQPIVVNDGGDGHFDPSDFIEFYAHGIDTVSTGANTYWLRSGNGSASRLPVSAIIGGDPVTGSLSFTYSREERGLFIAAIPNGDQDSFYGPLVLNDPPVTQDLKVGNLDTGFAGNATLAVTIQGATDQQAHLVAVAIGSHALGTAALNNQEQQTFTFNFPQSWLVNGTNTLTYQALDGDNDVDLIALTRLTYQHLLRADNGSFEVNLPGGRIVTVGGFTQNVVRAIDVTDLQNPIELQTSVATDPMGGFAATFTPPGNGSHIVMVFDPTRVLTPPEMTVNTPSSLIGSKQNGADLVIITNSAFTAAATTLKPVREAAGLVTTVVDVEDIYDEFNFGIRSTQAIRSYLEQAATKWKKPPRYVILVGDASIDPRNYLDLGAFDFVPTKLVNTTLIKTASDDWFTDFNGDGIADIPIGRIPVRTAAQANLIFGKLTSRGTPSGAWANTVLFVSDRTTDFDFAGVANSLARLVPGTMTTQKIDYNVSASPGNDTINALNNGVLIADYIGHASVEIWSDNVFSSTSASNLTNGSKLPFVVAMDCLNGYFHDLYTTSLAEAFLEAPNGGAVAVWASSTLTQPDQQAIMNSELIRQLFAGPHVAIGDAVTRAKKAATDPDVLKSWILFGDPSMPLH